MDDRSEHVMPRRDVLKRLASAAGGIALSGKSFTEGGSRLSEGIRIDPSPLYELSPYLFMQFMEPLGATDSSVDAAWDYHKNAWREDVVEVTKALAPTMLRWGGCFSSYYRWKEGVGSLQKRKPMYNLLWGGMESNHVGTAEFVAFCRLVGAEPLMCVNFESDGRKRWMRDPAGQSRCGDAQEAADWVRYCNASGKHPIKIWQIGNETSYDRKGHDRETGVKKTVEFAVAMRKADPEIGLIGWGDSGWASRMIQEAGDHLQYVAFHHMFNPDDSKEPVLEGERYRRDPDAAWNRLMQAWKINDEKICRIRESLGGVQFPLAMTECHFSIQGRDRCDVMSTWAAGVAYARMFNNFQRHGDLLKIATGADFCGNRWQVNAVLIPTPRSKGNAYLMPVARLMKLYRNHIGQRAVKVEVKPNDLDVVASRTGDRIFLHAVNTNRIHSLRSSIDVSGKKIVKGRVLYISEDPTVELSYLNSGEVMQVSEASFDPGGIWTFPAASVTTMEIEIG